MSADAAGEAITLIVILSCLAIVAAARWCWR
jgi:hypothetical protein